MDAVTYGRLVHAGGYATGGILRSKGLVLVGEAGPVVVVDPNDVRRIDEGAIIINQWRERNGYPPVRLGDEGWSPLPPPQCPEEPPAGAPARL